MRLVGVRRIRSSLTDHRRSSSSGGTSGGAAAGTSTRQRGGVYDVDDMTNLDEHRRLSASMVELQRLREKAALSARDANRREQELHRVKSEHATVRQQLEHIIRDLLERQKGLSEEVRQSHHEMQLLREEAAANHSARVAVREAQHQQLQEELQASQSREAEAAGELAVVMEKLVKADTYIKTLSDEAVEYQLGIERLQQQLDAATKELARKHDAREEESKLITSEETARKKKEVQELWTELVTATLECADSCDTMSRECDEFIDVIKEEQQRACQRQSSIIGRSSGGCGGTGTETETETVAVKMEGKKGPPQERVTFMSCKPTGAELERLLHTSRAPRQHGESEGKNKDSAIVWEGTARVIARVLRGMQMALRESKGDVLVAGRAYAELCRAGRSVAAEVAELQAMCGEERAMAAALAQQLAHAQHDLRVEKERADHLQASLDETSDIMAEAAALAEERTSRMEKLLRENTALEEALQAQRASLRERDDAVAAAEQKLRTLQDTMRREQTECYSIREELQRSRQEAKTVQEDRDAARCELHELERNMQVLKEAMKQSDVDCRYLRKCIEELQRQLAQAQKEKDALSEVVESGEREKRQLRVQIDRSKRDGNSTAAAGLCTNVSAPSPLRQWKEQCEETEMVASSVNQQEAGSLRQPPQGTEPMDKVRWWKEKLQAITSSVSSPTPLFSTPPACRKEEKIGLTDDFHILATNSATLASLAYGASPPSRKPNGNRVIM
ncbi:hypothetical protein TraAM80_02948 [Trypanosoma rangeli]|uniref:Uncharacterized protein n=1 Tax=Trypanosoma rangeli TaxID=5698 RepID=A0A422NRD4_TRYRA|nr:uncharacterized protein TraAM80_02948 [Trypanosoma rangeli]RNF08016.1 hypothetical protein TraAM80_02948 [Trypanosoma rangeli]|eukprot:RNF08016.1 hypothetical protein TraAM80_02948 [Trypanosoma rangeli]